MKKRTFIFAAGVMGLAASEPTAAAELRERVVSVRADSAVRIVQPARVSVRAATRLGFRYEFGRGVPQDYVLAATWYRHAAERGDPDAQHLLGLMYDRGHGVPVDFVEAHKWLNLAAAVANSRNREYYIRMRAAVASKMGRAEIAEAQWRASHWVPALVR